MADTKPSKSGKATPEQPAPTPSSARLGARPSTTQDKTARSGSKRAATAAESAQSKAKAPNTEAAVKREHRETPQAKSATSSRIGSKKPSREAVASGASSKKAGALGTAAAFPDAKEVYRMTAEAAYYLAEKRNFAPGHEQEDWEAARAEVMAQLEKRKG